MAAPVTKLPQIQLPAGPAPETPDQRYWRSFRSHLQVPSTSSYPVTHITTPASAPQHSTAASSDLFAVTAGPRVQVFSSRTRKVIKTIGRFDDVARSGDIRRDGRILLAGDDTGTIQAFDINSRAILKTWKEHKQPVWTTKFAPSDLTTLMSASDDRTVRLWDLPSQQSTRLFSGHGDYVRTGAFLSGTNSDILVSGSYDETVRVWDSRAPGGSVMTFKHRAPVECVLPMPSGTTVLASSDNQVSVLDLVAGKPLQLLKAHQKTVTSLCLASKASRVVAAGLDGHLKVFETMGWNVVAGYKYPSAILAVSVISSGGAPEDKHLVVGLQSGLLSVRTRSSQQEQKRESEREREMQALMQGNLEEHDRKKSKKRSRKWERTHRGMDFSGEGADIVIEDGPKRKKKKRNKPMAPWQTDLRRGRYGAALDRVLHKVGALAAGRRGFERAAGLISDVRAIDRSRCSRCSSRCGIARRRGRLCRVVTRCLCSRSSAG